MNAIFCAGQILDGTERDALLNHAICVCDGMITDFDVNEKVIRRNRGCEIIDREDWLITPAFINAHDHGRAVSPFSFGMRDACLELWIQEFGKVAPIPAYDAAFYDGLNLADTGVGTVLHSHTPSNAAHFAKEIVDTVHGYNDAGIRVAVCPSYMDQNKGVYADRDAFAAGLPEQIRNDFIGKLNDCPVKLKDYFAEIDRLLSLLEPQFQAGMASLQLHPNGGQWCSDEALLAIKEYALSHGLRIHMHLLETKYQRAYAIKKWGCSFIQHYRDIGFLGPWVSFAHAVWINDEDINMIAKSGAVLVTNPSSNIRLHSGQMPLKRILNHDVVCGLGMDGCALDDDQDYVREMRLSMFNIGETGVNAGIHPSKIMKLATQNGAAVTGGCLSPGVIRAGLPADIVCFDRTQLEYPYTSPEVGALEMLLQRGTKHMIDAVYVNGIKVSGREDHLMKRRSDARETMTSLLDSLLADKKREDRSELIAAIHDFYEKWEEEMG